MAGPEHDVDDLDHCRACAACRRTHNRRARAHAQGRALKLLARTFQIEYSALYLQELSKEDVVDVPRSRAEKANA